MIFIQQQQRRFDFQHGFPRKEEEDLQLKRRSLDFEPEDVPVKRQRKSDSDFP